LLEASLICLDEAFLTADLLKATLYFTYLKERMIDPLDDVMAVMTVDTAQQQ